MAEGDVASTGNATNTNGRIDVDDGTVTADDALAANVGETDGSIIVSGITFDSCDYSDTLLSAGGSDVILTGADISMGVSEPISGTEQAGTAACVDSGMLTISESTMP